MSLHDAELSFHELARLRRLGEDPTAIISQAAIRAASEEDMLGIQKQLLNKPGDLLSAIIEVATEKPATEQ